MRGGSGRWWRRCPRSGSRRRWWWCAAYATTLKTRSTTRWPVALRRFAQMRRDYPRKPFLAAVVEAAHFGLYDLERLDRMVLRHIAHDYFVVPDTRRDE
jgi:hypothetical protein